MFLVPLLFNQLDSEEEKRAEALKKRADEMRQHIHKKDLSFKLGSHPGQTERDSLDKQGQENILMNEGQHSLHPAKAPNGVGMAHGDEDALVKESRYGPRQVMKPGELGNFEPRDYKIHTGPGEGGEPVYTSMAEKMAADRSVREFGFNMVASDKIAMDRTIPDTRMEECKYWHYPEKLPTASVIIVFHNEGWSTLLRTVHSVINMSPPHLLHEVVMVDDFSDKVHLKQKLDDYIKQFSGLVKLYRNKERLGLIRTRTLGAEYATGDVIVFLDAHCECNRNWLVPLLARIAYDRTILAVPFIDGIDWDNFRYSPVYQPGQLFRGIFEWGFLYKETTVPEQERAKHQYASEPYWSPTHAGGLFAMDRKYFFELGAYDPGLLIWGGENFELSFKIWQCGGSVEWVPCSRVGHVYRNSMPYGFGNVQSKIPITLANYMRVVEVWLDDEFKEYFYTREPTVRGFPVSNITKQLEFKKSHNCKSFKWFIENIAYDIVEKFPYPPPNKAWGEIKQKHGTLCWDTKGQRAGGGGYLDVTPCHHYGGNQMFRLNVAGQIAFGERCIEKSGDGVTIIFCPVQPSGPWQLTDSGQLRHQPSGTCAEAAGHGKLYMMLCDESKQSQKWEINEIRTWQR